MKSFEESKKADRAVQATNKPRPKAKSSGVEDVVINGKEEEGEEECPRKPSVEEGARTKSLARPGVAMRGGGRRGKGGVKKAAPL